MNHDIRSSKNFLHYYDFYHPFLFYFSYAHVYLKAISVNNCAHGSVLVVPTTDHLV